WIAGRLDACFQTTGNYARGNGMRLDLCAGIDGGATFVGSGTGGAPPTAGQTLPSIAVGPSVALHGELGRDAALTVRFGAGLNIARDSFEDGTGDGSEPPLATLQLEVDFSWSLPSGGSRPLVARRMLP